MSRFSEVARLKELEAKANPEEIGISRILYDNGNHLLQLHAPGDKSGKTNFGATHDQAALLASLYNAAPWLLKIAEAFQPGDSIMLRELAHDEEQTAKFIAGFGQPDTRKATMLRRLQAVAEEMER